MQMTRVLVGYQVWGGTDPWVPQNNASLPGRLLLLPRKLKRRAGAPHRVLLGQGLHPGRGSPALNDAG